MSKDFRDGLAKKIRSARIDKGMTQTQLAQKIGVTTSCLSFYENAKRMPNMMTMSLISRALGMSLDDLVPDVDLEAPKIEGQTNIYDLIGEQDEGLHASRA